KALAVAIFRIGGARGSMGARDGSVPVCGVAVAAGAELLVEPARDLLEEARGDATLGLALFFFFAGQPRDLDDAALTLVGQVSVEGIVGALEDHEFAVQRFH